MRIRLRGRASPALALVLAILSGGCADGGAGRPAPPFAEVVDDAGREVRVAVRPARVISLIPAVTELIRTLGAGDRLAARTLYDRDPALAGLPSVGQGLTPNLEALVALRPDLVVAWPDGESRAVVARLAGLGIPVYGARIDRLDDVVPTIRRIGTLLGIPARADSLVGRIEAELAAVRHAVAGLARPTVLYLVGEEPLTIAGAGTFTTALIEVAGGRNVFADGPAGWPAVALEAVVRRQPDVVILPRGEGIEATLAGLRRAPGWRDLHAVQAGRVHAVDAELFNRPGPRVGLVARRLAALLHPDAVAEPAP